MMHDQVGNPRAYEGLQRVLAKGGTFDVIEASLWVAADEYPELDVPRERARIAFLAEEGASRVEGLLNPFARLDALTDFLYVDLGFRGNAHNYRDPRNSFLNDVLNRRLGIPLTLSILFIEIARRAGFTTRGVGLPGHFIVRLEDGGRSMLVDPFHGGRVITEEDCQDLVSRTTGRPELYRKGLLDGTDSRAMLVRLLSNLKNVFVQRKDYERALSIVERLLLVRPDNLQELRDRGLLRAHCGHTAEAIDDLETYLGERAGGQDQAAVEARLVYLQRKLSELN